VHLNAACFTRDQTSGALNEPTEPRSLPHFIYEPSFIPSRRHLGRILIGDKVFHHIDNLRQFYETFGKDCDDLHYTFEEEFLWDRYRRDDAKMSSLCFQLQLAVYLHRYSMKFKELFSAAYEAMIGKCSLDCVDKGDWHCAKCPMHPHSSDTMAAIKQAIRQSQSLPSANAGCSH
jgi:hypothetical protein